MNDTIKSFIAYREDGTVAYSGVLDGSRDLSWYSDGHPLVHRIVVRTHALSSEEEVPVDRSPARLKSWNKRNGG